MAFRNKLAVLSEQQPFVGHVNRQVIDEWHGTRVNPPLQLLRLPKLRPQQWQERLLSGQTSVAMVEHVLQHPACAECFMRYLGRSRYAAHARTVSSGPGARAKSRASMAIEQRRL